MIDKMKQMEEGSSFSGVWRDLRRGWGGWRVVFVWMALVTIEVCIDEG